MREAANTPLPCTPERRTTILREVIDRFLLKRRIEREVRLRTARTQRHPTVARAQVQRVSAIKLANRREASCREAPLHLRDASIDASGRHHAWASLASASRS